MKIIGKNLLIVFALCSLNSVACPMQGWNAETGTMEKEEVVRIYAKKILDTILVNFTEADEMVGVVQKKVDIEDQVKIILSYPFLGVAVETGMPDIVELFLGWASLLNAFECNISNEDQYRFLTQSANRFNFPPLYMIFTQCCALENSTSEDWEAWVSEMLDHAFVYLERDDFIGFVRGGFKFFKIQPESEEERIQQRGLEEWFLGKLKSLDEYVYNAILRDKLGAIDDDLSSGAEFALLSER